MSALTPCKVLPTVPPIHGSYPAKAPHIRFPMTISRTTAIRARPTSRAVSGPQSKDVRHPRDRAAGTTKPPRLSGQSRRTWWLALLLCCRGLISILRDTWPRRNSMAMLERVMVRRWFDVHDRNSLLGSGRTRLHYIRSLRHIDFGHHFCTSSSISTLLY